MPRQRKSTEEHKLNGTFKKTRHSAKSVKLKPHRPTAPDHLSEQAKAYFNQVADQLENMGVLTLPDVFSLTLIAETMAEVHQLGDFLKKNGRTYECETVTGTMHRPFPQAQMHQDASKRLANLYKEYGLTAQSRGKVPIQEKPTASKLREMLDHEKHMKAWEDFDNPQPKKNPFDGF